MLSDALFHTDDTQKVNSTVRLMSIQLNSVRPAADAHRNREQAWQFLPCDALRCTVFGIVILSVCLSVCHTRGLSPHGLTYDRDFFTIW